MGSGVNEILNKIKEILNKAKEYIKNIDLEKVKKSIKNIDREKMKESIKKLPETIKNIDMEKIKSIRIDPAKIKKNYIWIILGILVAAFILTKTIGKIKQVFGPKVEEAKEMVEFLETTPVKVYKIKHMDFKDTLPVMGRIMGSREIELRFDGKGVIESFNFEEGERILEGDIITSIDQKDALLKLKYSSLELEKTKKLYEIGGVEKLAVDQKKLEYESARRDLEKTNIYAPSDGYLGSKDKDEGAFVTSQDKVGIFVDFSEVYVAFDVIEEDSPKMELGQNVEVFLDAYPGLEYKGTVDKVSPIIEGRTRTQTVQVELDNEDNLLKPGMFARGIVSTYEKKDALIIPASSFKKKENRYFIYIVHLEEEEAKEEEEDMFKGEVGVVEEREIEIEYLTHDVAEVGKGAKEDELVIRELHQEYKDQDKVEITEIQETLF